eukprot:15831_1
MSSLTPDLYSLHSFNCVGEDNYIQKNIYSEDELCDDEINKNSINSDLEIYYDYYPHTLVTDICYSHGVYAYDPRSYSCNELFVTISWFESETDCQKQNNIISQNFYSMRQCQNATGFVKCISNNHELLPETPRYFVDYDNANIPHHYPIDICNAIGFNFVLYECQTTADPNQQFVTKYNNSINYPNCTDPTPIVTNYTSPSHSILLHSFNCVGEDDFVEYIRYTEDACGEYDMDANDSDLNFYDDYVSFNYVTGICYKAGDMYWQILCNGFFSKESYFNSLFECQTSTNAVSNNYYPSRQCKDNWRLNKCVSNGILFTPYSYIEQEKTFPIAQRITLIDLYFNLHLGTSTAFMLTCLQSTIAYQTGFLSWDLSEIAIHGKADEYCFLQTEYIYDQGTNMSYLTVSQIWLLNTATNFSLTSTIPESICNLKDLRHIAMGYVQNENSRLVQQSVQRPAVLSGTIPECLWNISNLETLEILGTDLTGTISDNICNAHITNFKLSGSVNMTGTIPKCEHFNISTFILQNSSLTGTIPTNIFCNYFLSKITITNNIYLSHQQIPRCFSDEKRWIEFIRMSKSNFVGTLPSIPICYTNNEVSGPYYIDFSDNNLEGTLSEIFKSYFINESAWRYIRYIYLQNNNFYEEDISYLLKKIFTAKSQNNNLYDGDMSYLFQKIVNVSHNAQSVDKLYHFSIANNPNIHGSLPNVDLTIPFHSGNSNGDFFISSAFLAHNCDLEGTIPESLHFVNLEILSLYNNRLSGYIPPSFTNKSSKFYSLILLGNYLWEHPDGLPEWINSPFSTAPNLYYSWLQFRKSILMVIMSILGIIVSALWRFKVHSIFQRRFTHNLNAQSNHKFIDTVKLLQTKLTNWKLCICIVMLLLFAPLNANYYYSVPFESLFELSWYKPVDSQKWNKWILLIVAVIYCYVILYTVWNIDATNKKPVELDGHLSDDQPTDPSFASRILKIFVSFVLWLLGMCWIILYVIASSLPNENVIGLTETWSAIITRSMSLILITNNKLIIPFFVDSVTICCGRDAFIISTFKLQLSLILQLINSLFLPFLATIFFANSCGKYWVHLWDYCSDERKDIFNKDTYNFVTDSWMNLISADDVCTNPSIAQMNFNKCIRTFLYKWTAVLMMKLIYGMLMQILSLFFKLFKHRYLSKCSCTKCTKCTTCAKCNCTAKFLKKCRKWVNKENEIHIDKQQMSIILNLLISIVFCFFAPLLMPLTFFSITLRVILFYMMRYQFRWKVVSDSIVFPTQLLFIGVILSQVIAGIYFVYCIKNVAIVIIFIVFLVVMDIHIGYKKLRT